MREYYVLKKQRMGAQQSAPSREQPPAYRGREPFGVVLPPRPAPRSLPVPAASRTKPTMPPKDRIAAKTPIAVPGHPLAP